MNIYLNFYQLVAIGWGQKSTRSAALSNELQQVTLRTISSESESCDILMPLNSRQFCAGVDRGLKGKTGATIKETTIFSI